MKEINFLRERRKTLSKQELADKKVLKISSIFFGIFFAFFALVFGLHFFLTSRINAVRSQQDATRSQIVADQPVEKSFVVFVHKLTVLAQLFKDRAEKRDAVDYLTTAFAPDVFIKQIDFNQKDKLLIFRVQANDIFHLQKVFDVANSDATRQKFASITTSNLERMSDGHYEMNIVVLTKPAS